MSMVLSYFYMIIALIMVIVADGFLKKSSIVDGSESLRNALYCCILYGLSGIPWYLIMRQGVTLVTMGIIWSALLLLGTSVLGVFFFKEPFERSDAIAMFFACVALIVASK